MPKLPTEGCKGLGTEKSDRGRPIQANTDHEAFFQHVLSGKMVEKLIQISPLTVTLFTVTPRLQ